MAVIGRFPEGDSACLGPGVLIRRRAAAGDEHAGLSLGPGDGQDRGPSFSRHVSIRGITKFTSRRMKAKWQSSRASETQLWDVATKARKVRWDPEGLYLNMRGVYFDGAGRLLALVTPSEYSWSWAGYLHDAATGRLVRKVAFPEEIAPSERPRAGPQWSAGRLPRGYAAEECHDGGRVINVCDVTTGKLLTVVEVPQDHFLAPRPGLHAGRRAADYALVSC